MRHCHEQQAASICALDVKMCRSNCFRGGTIESRLMVSNTFYGASIDSAKGVQIYLLFDTERGDQMLAL